MPLPCFYREFVMKRFFCVFLLLALTLPAWAQEKKEPANNKAGVLFYTISGTGITLDNKTSGANPSGDGTMIGPSFFYEYLILGHFGVGLSYASGLTRTITTADGNADINIEETATLAALDFKAYFADHKRGGMKPYIGVTTGTVTPTSLVNITTSTNNSTTTTTETTGIAVPVTLLNFGIDYTVGYAGVRVEAGMITGAKTDHVGSDTYQAAYTYNGGNFAIGVFSHF